MTDNEIKRLAQRQFSQNPMGYVQTASFAQGGELARLVALIQPQPHWLALDVATGGGHTALTFAPHVRRIVASDLTMRMLAAARQHISGQAHHNVVYQQIDAEALPFQDASLDLVTCRIAPHHFPNVFQFFQEVRRVLRPGSVFALVDQITPEMPAAARYVNAFERLRDPSHVWSYSLESWQGLLLDAGMKVWHSETFTRRHRLLDWAERMRCSPETTARLQAMHAQAPPAVQHWFEPEATATSSASFLIHQAVILGRADDS